MHLLSSLLAVASEGDCGEVWQQCHSCQLSSNTLKFLFILVTTSKLLKYLSNCSLYTYYKKPVATDCNRFLLVFEYSKKKATSNHNQLWKWATTTNGLVAIGCVRSGFSHFFGPSNRTFKHYFYPSQQLHATWSGHWCSASLIAWAKIYTGQVLD